MKLTHCLVLASTLLCGCAATHTLPPADLQYGDAYLPPIHVMTDDALKGGEIRNSLRATGMFEDVLSGMPPAGGYAVRIKVAQERDGAAFPLVLLSAATLFLLPLSMDEDTRLDFTLLKGDRKLKGYSYENRTRSYFWLFDRGDEAQAEHMRRLTRSFARDVQRDGLMQAGGTAL